MTNEITIRETVDDIVANYDEALRLYEKAIDAIGIADEAVKAAHAMAHRASGGHGENSYNRHAQEDLKQFFGAVRMPDRDKYIRTARRLTAINVWSHIIKMTRLESLMDKESKDKLRDQLRYVPERTDHTGQIINQDEIARSMPPITVENINATLDGFAADSRNIMLRGIANAFSDLDRRFKSHDGFKVGSRIILDHTFSEWGGWSRYDCRDTLIDVERIFAILDNDGVPLGDDFTNTINLIEADRRGAHGARQSETDTPYFLARAYKNGNLHLWMKRDDLVRKVNRLLGLYYGETIADGQTAPDDPLADVKTTPAKNLGFFPTPPEVVKRIMDTLKLWRRDGNPQLRGLEPSAGTGNILFPMIEKGVAMDAVEIEPGRAEALGRSGLPRKTYRADFLDVTPAMTGVYDIIAMNPPFDRERDIDHVNHALSFLKPGGQLVAIMSAGTCYRSTKKSEAFRAKVEAMGGRFWDLPAGSFSSVGTNINTNMLTIG